MQCFSHCWMEQLYGSLIEMGQDERILEEADHEPLGEVLEAVFDLRFFVADSVPSARQSVG